MSTTIDEKVLEMRFDNKNFESNVSNTLSTLDKLKQKLNLSGASKGLENVQSAANKCNMSGLSGAVDTVQAKFSALQVMGVTALANITNSAVNAGKNIISALTLDPVMDGFHEYETQMNAVQTILANTQSKGTTLDQVNAALDTLNTYADKTIYNFTEMTRNIGTFTAAGVDLQTSVDSIQGIANLAAVSGSNSQQASTAMYQLSQAIATGTVKLMDWNSVVNAGMGGQVFQDALIRTSEHLKTGAKAAVAAKGSFRESLSTGWLTTQVLTETLKQFSLSVDTAEDYNNAIKQLVSEGYTQEEAKAIADMAKTAGDAATKVKTFSQLIDTLKEALGSGWTKTWQLVLGDFEEAKELFSGISDFLSDLINKSADARNKLLESALGKGFTGLSKKLNDLLEPAKKAADTVKNVSDSISDLGTLVDDVILGKFGNGKERFDALTNSGKNYYEVQNKVNEKLGDSFRYTSEQIESQNKLLGVQEKTTESTSKAEGETKKLTDAQKDQIKKLAKLSDEQLKSKGYTDKQIAAFRELRETAEKLGIPLDTFIDKIDEINGRWLLINSFKNIGESIFKIFKAIGDGFREIFDPIKPEQLFNAIAAFHKFTSSLVMSDESADKLKRTFKGLFALINIVTTFTGGVLSTAFKLLSTILGAFNLDILSVTAAIGDMLVGLRDFILNNSLVTKGIELLAQGITFLVNKVKEWYSAFLKMPQVQKFIERIREAFDGLSKAFDDAVEGFKSGKISIEDILSNLGKSISKVFDNLFKGISFDDVLTVLSTIGEKIRDAISNFSLDGVGGNIIEGLVNGIKDGSGKVIEEIVSIGSKLLEAIKALLGIHSPSTEFFDIGKNIVEGLINGIKSMLEPLLSFFKGVGQGIIDVFKNIDFGVVLTAMVGTGVFTVFYKFAKAMDKFGDAAKNLTSPIKSISGMFDALKGAITNLGKAASTKLKAEAFKSIAVSIGILVGAIFVLCQLDVGKVWNAVGVITVLSGVLVGLSYALTKLGGEINGFDAAKLAATLLSVGTALILFAAVMKIISTMSWEDLGKAAVGMLGMAGIVAALVAVTKYAGSEKQIEQSAAMIKKVGVALLIMAVTAKIVAGMSWEDLGKAGAGIGGLSAIIVGLIAATKLVGDKEIASIGKTLLAISGAIALLAIVAKLISGMSWEEMGKAAVGIGFLSAIVVGLIAATNLVSDKDISKIGSTIFAVGGAMALLAVTAKIISGMSWEEMGKAAVGITFLGGIVTGLIAATRLAGDKELTRVATTLLAMSASIAILAGVCVILGLVKTENLVKGIVAVGALSVMVGFMVAMTKNANDVKGTMIGIAIAIGVMAGALVILSRIEPGPLFKAVTALSIVMGMFALVEKMSGSVTTSFKTLIVMTAALGLIAGALGLLSLLPADQSIQNAVAISTVLLALAASCRILDGVGTISKSAIKSMAVLTGIIATIAIILGVMSALDVQASLPNVIALSTMLMSMSAACAVLGTITNVSDSAMIAMGVLTGVVAALAVILGIMDVLDIQASLPNAIALSVMLLSMSAAVGILGAIGPLAESAVAGAAGLVAVVGILAAAIAAFGAIKQIPGVDWLISEGGDFLQSIGTAIGQFIGGIVGGVAEGATSTLPQVATNLSEFMTNVQPFIDGASGIDPSAMDGVKTLAETILLLTGADILNAITSWLTGGSSLTGFVDQLIPFGQGMKDYAAEVSGIDTGAITASASAAKALAEVANSIPTEGGLWGLIAGDKNLGEFASHLIPFGQGMKSYAEQVAGIDTGAITASASAAKGLVEVANSIPTEGGLWGLIAGNKNLGQFASHLIPFGKGMKSYAEQVAGINTEAITSSVDAARGLVKVANSIPTDGGLWSLIAGDKDLGSFGAQLVKLGNGMSDYSDSVSGIDIDAISSSITCANRFKNLAQALVDFDYSGIDNFKIKTLGDKLKSYSDSVSGVNQDGISSSISAIRRLINLINSMAGIDTSGIGAFKSAINQLSTVELGKITDNFSAAVPKFAAIGSNLINALVNGMRSASGSMIGVVVSLMNSLLSGVRSAQGRCVAMGASIVRGLATGMASGSGFVVSVLSNLLSMIVGRIEVSAAQFRTIGMLLMTNFKMGITVGGAGVASGFTSVMSNCLASMTSYYGSFFSCGVFVASGFAAGIRSGAWQAKLAATAMANAAEKAARDALKINSPSKVFRAIGKGVPEGFVQGIGKLGNRIKSSTLSMANASIDAAKSAMSRLGSTVSNGMDVTPTISPVVDMSNTKYQMAELRLGASIGNLVSQPVNSLSDIVSKAQAEINASNAEVVSAVNGLRDDLNTMYESDDQEIALYVDAKKLASSIAKPMNRQLNIISKREGGL